MGIPLYWTNYKWSNKATTLSKMFSVITVIGSGFSIIFLVSGNAGGLLTGLLLLCAIVLLNTDLIEVITEDEK